MEKTDFELLQRIKPEAKYLKYHQNEQKVILPTYLFLKPVEKDDFRHRFSTTYYILALPRASEQTEKYNLLIYLLFEDIHKAFEHVES